MKIFHAIKAFFQPEQRSGSGLEKSQKHRLSRFRAALHWLLIFAGGCFAASAFAPLNWTVAAFTSITVLLLEARNRSALKAALAGWVWGMGYALCGFFWLREINPVIPWLMMIVLGAYYIPVGWTAAVAGRFILLPSEVRSAGFTEQEKFRDFSFFRQLAWCLVTAGSFVLVEYLRSNVLPWNYFGSAFWRNAVVMQLVRYTGIAGLTFLAAMFNSALALAILTIVRKDEDSNRYCYRRPVMLLLMLLVLSGVMAFGIVSLRERRKEYESYRNKVRLTLVQGKLSQRRFGGEESAYEALSVYTELTRSQAGVPTDLVVWPETAVNYPLRGSAMVCALYREQVRILSSEMKSPMLLGTLEFDLSTNPPGSLNSAVLTDTRDLARMPYRAMYSKVHPVPFGEYVPMRRYLPDWVIKLIDMQRDLTPGKSLEPISLNDNIRFGVNICFEDVFAYISRAEFMRKANILLVITNDAWYPASSEPEQHLANSVARAIETNLPMVRCGNDSATCLIAPSGEIIWSLADALGFGDGKPFRRGAGAETITVNVPADDQINTTFYTRFGDWIVGVAALFYVLGMCYILQERLKFFRKWEI